MFVTEVFGTCFLVAVIISVEYSMPSNNPPLVAATIALTYYGMIMVTSKISGGCLNPAVAFSAIITQFKPFVGLYFFATMIGGMLGGVIGGLNEKVMKAGDDDGMIKFNYD